jgi:peptidoglycan/LPS O-acetylase OafA/YrhL
LFFMLSGLVLSIPYFRGDRRMTSAADARRFIVHRAWRLLPLFVAACVIGYAIRLATSPDARALDLVMSLTTASMFNSKYWFSSPVGVLWSLNIEIWFSALFPTLILVVLRHGMRRPLVVVFVVALAVRIIGARFPTLNPNIDPIKDSLPGRLDDFMVGILIARLYVDGRLENLNPAFAALGVFLLLCSGLLWSVAMGGALPRASVVIFNNISQLGFGLIIATALSKRRGIAKWVLDLWPLRVLGAMCFSLYVWHLYPISPAIATNPFAPQAILQYWVALLLVAGASYRFIEFPHGDWRQLFLLPPRADR